MGFSEYIDKDLGGRFEVNGPLFLRFLKQFKMDDTLYLKIEKDKVIYDFLFILLVLA